MCWKLFSVNWIQKGTVYNKYFSLNVFLKYFEKNGLCMICKNVLDVEIKSF